MTTAATSLLGLALPVTGELSGTWGSTVNDSITSLLDTAVAGTTTLSTDADVTLTTTTLASNQARQAILLCSGARTALRTITAPAQSKIYTIINATTGGYSVKLVGVGPTTGLTIPNGASAVVAWNGSDFIEVGSATVGNLTVNGNLSVTGTSTLTGATTIQGLTVGKGAGAVSTNTAVGASALTGTGQYNTAVGYQALAANTTANGNTAIGTSAAIVNTTGFNLSAVGAGSLQSNTTGSNNTAVGRDSAFANTTGGSNTALGQAALFSNTTASYNTAVGYQAGYTNATGTALTAIGYFAANASTAGRNTAVGAQTMRYTSTGVANVAVGGGDGAIEYATFSQNTTGSYNTAIGWSALALSTTASNNTAVGYQAGYSNTTGTSSTFLGFKAGYSQTSPAGPNTFVGYLAGYSCTTGEGNVALGGSNSAGANPAGYLLTTGSRNTLLGAIAGGLITTGSKNTVIGNYNGNQGGLDIRTASNYIVLSDGDGAIAAVYSQSGNGSQNIERKGNLADAYSLPTVIAGTGASIDCVEAVNSTTSATYGWMMRIYFTIFQGTGSSKNLRLTFSRAQDPAIVGFRMLVTGEYASDAITEYIARVATAGGGGGTYSSSNYAVGDGSAGSWTNPGGSANFYWQSGGAFIASNGGVQGILEIIAPGEGIQAFSSVTIGYA